MWPFTKKKEKLTEEKAKEQNFKLECARDQINAELTKFRNKLLDKNSNIGLPAVPLGSPSSDDFSFPSTLYA